MARSSHKAAALLVAVALLAALAVPSAGFAAKAAKHPPATGLRPATASFPEDAYEPDDTTATAHLYNPAVDGNTWTSYRTIHGYGSTIEDGGDWVKITVTATGTPIWVETEYVDGYYDSYLKIFDAEDNLLTSDDDHDVWDSTYSSSIYYDDTVPGDYYVLSEPYDEDYYPYAYRLHVTVGDARRIWGANRYATAANLSRLMWDNTGNPWYGTGYGPGCIVVASGLNPADALAGGSLAAQMDGVLLLTNPAYLSSETKQEIERVSESLFWDSDDVQVYVLGGPGAVSDGVVKEIESMRHVTDVERLKGADRFATAVAIADEMADEGLTSPYAFLVNGYAWPDAVAAGPVAAWAQAPVLMTKASSVPTVTLDWLEDNSITDVYIVGGTGVVSDAVKTQLEGEGYSVDRIGGANRYETARNVATFGAEEWGMNEYIANLASGENFADALAAAPLSWWTGGPLLLTRTASLHPEVMEYFEDAGRIGDPGWSGCYVLGGPAAVSPATYAAFRDLWKIVND